MTRWRWASSRRSSAMAATSATTRPTRSTASSTRRRTSRRWRSTASSTVHAAELGQGVLPGEQPGDHRGPGGDEHELLRLLPGAGQPGDQPARREHRLLRQPARDRTATSTRRSAARASRSCPTRRTRRRRTSSSSGSSGRRAEEVGRARRLHLHAAVLESRGVPQRDALQRGLLPVDADGEGLLGGAGVRGPAVPDERPPPSVRRRRPGHGQGSARRTGGGLGRDASKK